MTTNNKCDEKAIFRYFYGVENLLKKTETIKRKKKSIEKKEESGVILFAAKAIHKL